MSKIFTKESLIEEFKKIKKMGWIKNSRPGNDGGIGNTLEDLLGIEENNLPLPNATEWELKTQRKTANSLVTLFHSEPSPRAFRFVPNILLPKYGWPHKQAGKKYPENEMSFRQTISGNVYSDRGFKVDVNYQEEKIYITFNASKVSPRHRIWLNTVKERIGLDDLNPKPYWSFFDLETKARTKLTNCFFVLADTKKIDGVEYYKFEEFYMLEKFDIIKFINEIENGNVYIDFDARTGHNHGTKFRARVTNFPKFYKVSKILIE